MLTRALAAAATVAVLVTGAPASAKPPKPPEPQPPVDAYVVVEIPTLPTHDGSYATAINESGQVVGWVYQGTLDGPRWVTQGFVWDRSSGLRILGQFNGREVLGADLNDKGIVAAGTLGFAYSPGTPGTWRAESGFSALSTAGMPGGGASVINNSGQVAGSVGFEQSQAVRWTAQDQPQFLGSLGTGAVSVPHGINEAGEVVGYARINASYYHAFL